jgi:hypothetical protein
MWPMNELDLKIAEAIKQQQRDDEFARGQQQIAALDMLSNLVECSRAAKQSGLRANRGSQGEVILMKDAEPVGQWSRWDGGFVFSYTSGQRPPTNATTLDEMTGATVEIFRQLMG